jgi:hypothetical protein
MQSAEMSLGIEKYSKVTHKAKLCGGIIKLSSHTSLQQQDLKSTGSIIES